ncbi:hypothetical protein BCR33DRAFT_110898 [Rhizoclosmatium globosum]|uniref:Uncharacterized protein n=1 Tax=Rhizoclosmatium globosum TaxID=329046 RepID=A0A1Y2CIS7_9FUNG|nr:hypothetical protein BCR33DRAFT_110898 [Rhizoclosmatium globosum]|eukprot:ORY46846.1 hypothetical protein BCR33DRAFT_110898 [Rhizoclosmatium globosum]
MDESDVSHAELSTVVSEDAELDGLWDFLTNGNNKTGAGNASLGDEFVNWENAGDDGGAAFDAFVQSLTSNEPIVTSTARCGIQEEVDKIKEVYHVQSEILELQNMGDESETVIVTLNGFAEMCLLERVVFTITDRARYEKLALKSVQNVEEVEPGIVGVAVTWKECSGKESTCSLDSRWMTDILHSLVELPV